MKGVGLLGLFTIVMAACGGQQALEQRSFDDDQIFSPRDALQMYLVLTNEPTAMEAPSDVEDMWRAVRGELTAFSFVSKHVSQIRVPADYRVDVELDFASLPHPKLSAKRLRPILRGLPTVEREKGQRAILAVSFRSRSQTLPQGNHIRLVGAAVLRAAERYDGVVVDLLARRAFTAAAWRRELNRRSLHEGQTRLAKRRASNGSILLVSRGHIKYGAPDLVLGPVTAEEVSKARLFFRAAQRAILQGNPKPGEEISVSGQTMPLLNCGTRGFDGRCVRLTFQRDWP